MRWDHAKVREYLTRRLPEPLHAEMKRISKLRRRTGEADATMESVLNDALAIGLDVLNGRGPSVVKLPHELVPAITPEQLERLFCALDREYVNEAERETMNALRSMVSYD